MSPAPQILPIGPKAASLPALAQQVSPVLATLPPPAAGVTRYVVEHETRYRYSSAISQSWQLARLTPRSLPWQKLLSYELAIEPPPDESQGSTDSFGNAITHFSLHVSHRRLSVRMRCMVDIGERVDPHATSGRSWESVRDAVRHHPDLDDLSPARLREPTGLVPLSEAARVYALQALKPGGDWLASMVALMRQIHEEFEFDPGATTVSTSVDEVLHQRRGVCQDFAHLMLACLRGHGLPARYVSGYLLTEPPVGGVRLIGVDASHAWVSAYSPDHGWVEFDPTNDTLADARYITLAYGADFADVCPVRGVILGSGEQALSVGVSVVPVDELVK
jgi:transglutaminase-like putative cysteine protease